MADMAAELYTTVQTIPGDKKNAICSCTFNVSVNQPQVPLVIVYVIILSFA